MKLRYRKIGNEQIAALIVTKRAKNYYENPAIDPDPAVTFIFMVEEYHKEGEKELFGADRWTPESVWIVPVMADGITPKAPSRFGLAKELERATPIERRYLLSQVRIAEKAASYLLTNKKETANFVSLNSDNYRLVED